LQEATVVDLIEDDAAREIVRGIRFKERDGDVQVCGPQ
jgi:hypothetical protein